MLSSTSMALTGELVSLSLRPELDPDPEQHRTPLTELEVEMFARRLLQESAGAPWFINMEAGLRCRRVAARQPGVGIAPSA
jgi:glutathione-specific gamma-glutamylcyclotransferase